MIETIVIDTNSSGASSVTTNERVTGYVNAISVTYAGGLSVSTNLTIAEQTDVGLNRTLLTRSATATSFVTTPVQAGALNDGTAVTNSFIPYFVSNAKLTVTVSASSASTTNAIIIKIALTDYNY